jgi:hypothetical protein
MTLQSVLEQYHNRIIRIRLKAHCMKSSLTYGERKAIAYYTAAAQTVESLIESPAPAWVGAQGKFVRL